MLIFPVGLEKESVSSKGLQKAKVCKGLKKEKEGKKSGLKKEKEGKKSVSKAANVPTKKMSSVAKKGKSRLSQPKRSLQSRDDDDDDEGVRFSHALCSNACFFFFLFVEWGGYCNSSIFPALSSFRPILKTMRKTTLVLMNRKMTLMMKK